MNTTNEQSHWTSDSPRDDGLSSSPPPSSSSFATTMRRSPVSPFPISPFSSIHNKSPTIQWSNNGMPKVATLVSRNEVMARAAALDMAPLLCRSGPTDDALQALWDDVSRTDEPIHDPLSDAFFDDLEPFENLLLDVLRCRSGPTDDDDDLKALLDDASLADDPVKDQASGELFLDGLEMFENLFLDVNMEVFETQGFQEPPLHQEKSSSRPRRSPGPPMVALTNHHYSSVATAAGGSTWHNEPAAVMVGPKNVVKKKRGRPKKKSNQNTELETNIDPMTVQPVRQVVIRLSLQSRIPMADLTNHSSSSSVVAVGSMGPRGSAPPGILVEAAENVVRHNNKKEAKEKPNRRPKLIKTNIDGSNEKKTKVHKAVIRRRRPAKPSRHKNKSSRDGWPTELAARTGMVSIQPQDTLSITPSNQDNV